MGRPWAYLDRRSGHHGRQRGGEAVAEAREPLVVDDELSADTEAAGGGRAVLQARHDHVHLIGGSIFDEVTQRSSLY